MKQVYLINAEREESYSTMGNDGCFPALGVISLATMVKNRYPDYDVRVFDAQITNPSIIHQLIESEKPDVVGVSVLATSYQPGLKYAQTAKQNSSIVIFGNDQAAVHGKNILKKRPEVDYICTADAGEYPFLAFLDYLEGNRLVTEVPQLLYRTIDGIHGQEGQELATSTNRFSALDCLAVPDRSLLELGEWAVYRENYLQINPRENASIVDGVTTINRARGCSRVKKPCSYCGIKDLTLRFSSPSVFWSDVARAQEQINANVFFEVFDSFSAAPQWIDGLVKARPSHLEYSRFFVYTQAFETNKKLIDMYKELGVFRVNFGLDSGNDTMLKWLKGQRDSVDINRKAVQLFGDSGIGYILVLFWELQVKTPIHLKIQLSLLTG